LDATARDGWKSAGTEVKGEAAGDACTGTSGDDLVGAARLSKLRVEYRKEQAADKPSGLTKVRRVLGADGRKSETALSVMRNGRHVKANKGVKGSHHFE
jgi:hypothetical protein